jgi:hypothetical protein
VLIEASQLLFIGHGSARMPKHEADRTVLLGDVDDDAVGQQPATQDVGLVDTQTRDTIKLFND